MKKERPNHIYSTLSNKRHDEMDDVFLGDGNFSKRKKDYAENFYNGHWDENYIDRYLEDE